MTKPQFFANRFEGFKTMKSKQEQEKEEIQSEVAVDLNQDILFRLTVTSLM